LPEEVRVSFDARDLTVHLVPGIEGPALIACNACNTTPGGVPKPACPPPSKPQPKCQAPSAKPPKGPKKRAAELEALDLALLRGKLRETLHRI
jgi:hypothetical protein